MKKAILLQTVIAATLASSTNVFEAPRYISTAEPFPKPKTGSHKKNARKSKGKK